MGFFSELKSDLSQAVNTLVPEDMADDAQKLDADQSSGNAFANAKADEGDKKIDLDSMLNSLDDINLDAKLDEAQDSEKEEAADVVSELTNSVQETEQTVDKVAVEDMTEDKVVEEPVHSAMETLQASVEEQETEEAEAPKDDERLDPQAMLDETLNSVQNSEASSYTYSENTDNGGKVNMSIDQKTPTDEVASITEGMVISGDIETTGSLDLIGKVVGNVVALGKLNVSGEIEGDSTAAEIYADAARITGEVKSQGSVKIGQSTVVIGNIYATSAVIAGAVKGDIDVHGPVVLDTTAIVMGNIKSQSVQINNGAVIEGMCSQSYAEVNPSAFFDGLKK